MSIFDRIRKWQEKRREKQARRKRELDQSYDVLVFKLGGLMAKAELVERGLDPDGVDELVDEALEAREKSRRQGKDVPKWSD